MIVLLSWFKMIHTLRQDFYMRRKFIKIRDAKIILSSFYVFLNLIQCDESCSFVCCWYCEPESWIYSDLFYLPQIINEKINSILLHVYSYSNPGLQIPTDHSFINSHFLSTLDISLGNVSSLSVETFANTSAVQRLDMRYYNPRYVDINILI